MELSNLRPAVGSVTRKTRIGRGAGSGKGGTSTRGHKGAKSRSGYSRKIGFEGGQMPFSAVSRNSDSKTSTALNTKQSTLQSSKHSLLHAHSTKSQSMTSVRQDSQANASLSRFLQTAL